MTVAITIPPLGESITHGILSCWYAQDGQWVELGQNLYQLETDKISMDGVAEKAGILHIQTPAGEEVQIHQTIGFIDGKAAPKNSLHAQAIQNEAKAKLAEPLIENPKMLSCQQALLQGASEASLLSTGSYNCSHYSHTDTPIPPSAEPRAATPPNPRTSRVPISPLRKTIAANLVRAKNQSASTTTFNEVNMEGIIHLRKTYQAAFLAKYKVKLGFMSFFVKAVTAALQQVPEVNTQLAEDSILMNHYYDIGIAIGHGKGLVVPVLRDCDQSSFADIERSIADYSQKTKEAKLKIEDLTGGVFTISNGGVYGSLLSTPLLNPPQSAILGMHAIQDRVIALKGQVVIRPMMNLALSYDHRLIDGKEAVSFLLSIKRYLEDTPEATFKEWLGL
jgi:2-oxoglutarate dehydrogenase E2 component (dihydrolipoamide succinyltransferase)